MGNDAPSLEELGYGPFFSQALERVADGANLWPARVSADSGDVYELAGTEPTRLGELAGRLRHTLGPGERPTTGDWVAITQEGDRAIIHHVLDRKTVLARRAAGRDGAPQIVAANVDIFFIVTSANRDFNPRRIERYLTAVWDGGARPVVVLNKIDLADDISLFVDELEVVALGVPVVGASAQSGAGMEELRAHLGRGTTLGFIGSSGVGKSSLINRMLGQALHTTDGIRADGKGRHTTTRRELVVLPDGGVLIDTPGMREFGLLADTSGLDATFPDIAALAASCRFTDCRHGSEPGCAVRAAVSAGELPQARLESHDKLRRELAAAEARRDPVRRSNAKRRWKSIHKEMRTRSKTDPKRRG